MECAAAFAQRLCSCISSDTIDTPDGMIAVTISLGVADSGKGGRQDAQALVKAADSALYKAKKNGRNRVEAVSNDGAV